MAEDYTLWVLHSPYPDHSWRGLEKCAAHDTGGPMLFDTQEEAQAFARTTQCDPYFFPVAVRLTVPNVRETLTVVAAQSADGGTR